MSDLLLNTERSLCTVFTKICDPINNCVHNDKPHPHQEVEEGCIIVKTLLRLRSASDPTYRHIRKT